MWSTLPAAAALLADCAENPPEQRTVKVHGLTTYYAKQYVGPVVRRLDEIHRAEKERLFAAAEASGNFDTFAAHCTYGVQDAIADAIFFARIDQSRQHDANSLEELAA